MKFGKEEREQAIQLATALRADGWTWPKVAKFLGVSKHTIYYWSKPEIRERGLERSREYNRKRRDMAGEYGEIQRERELKYQRERYASDSDFRERINERNRKYRATSEGRANINASHRRQSAKRKTGDPQFRIACRLRTRLWNALHGGYKAGSAVRDLGCSIAELKAYLQRRFKRGMSWDNYGEWHIDHKRPLASFDLTDREQFLEAVHFTNLQPLWGSENCSKGAKLLTA